MRRLVIRHASVNAMAASKIPMAALPAASKVGSSVANEDAIGDRVLIAHLGVRLEQGGNGADSEDHCSPEPPIRWHGERQRWLAVIALD